MTRQIIFIKHHISTQITMRRGLKEKIRYFNCYFHAELVFQKVLHALATEIVMTDKPNVTRDMCNDVKN